MKEVCVVLGAGAGIGGTVGRTFAHAGYHTVLCRRSDQSGLDGLVDTIQSDGNDASGFLLDTVKNGSIEQLVADIEESIGPIKVVVYNLGAQTGFHSLEDTSIKDFERGWRMATLGLFRVAKAVCPLMAARGGGTILVTSSTAAMRGNAMQHSHAAAMGGRRLLCQTLNAEFAAQGIHIAHILVDSMVDAPDTLGKILGEERFQDLRRTKGLEHDGLVLPQKVAEAYLYLTNQHRSTWTFELDLRSHTEKAWWNS